MGKTNTVPDASLHPNTKTGGNEEPSLQLLEKARADIETVLKDLGTQLGGLSEAEAQARLKQFVVNTVGGDLVYS